MPRLLRTSASTSTPLILQMKSNLPISTRLRAVDGKFQVVEFQLGLAFHFFGGFELAQSDLLRHGLAHQLERLLYEGARTGIELLDGPAGFEVVPHGLQQGRCAGRGHVPLDFERQGP